MTTTILLARHGQTDWNATGRYHGQANIPLNEVGRRQAQGLADALASEQLAAVYTSPLDRALDTARAVAAGRELTVNVDDRLLEVDVGSWTGLFEHEVFADDPAFEQARDDGIDYRLSSTGETTLECARRVADGVREIAAGHPGQRVLIVSHGYALQGALGELLGWTVEQSRRVEGPFNCALTELVVSDDQWRLVAHNITHPQIPEQRSGEVKTV